MLNGGGDHPGRLRHPRRGARRLGHRRPEIAELLDQLDLEGLLEGGGAGRSVPSWTRPDGGPRSERSPGSAWSPRGRRLRPPPSPRPRRGTAAPVGADAGAGRSVAGQRQGDLPLGIDVVDPDLDRLAQLEHVLDPLDPLALADLRDVE